ncbi:MAG: coproporphyrinogen III oxidase, partial [Planctomycetales bacterium 12-60-4]
EANPLDLTDDKLRLLREHGVNRISLGVQSFSNAHLRTLERDHTAEDLLALIPRVRQHFENLSIDLIFGVPGQTMEDWQHSLEQAIALGATHISTYGLTFEQGTAFETRRRRGLIKSAAEELERDMYAFAMDRLVQAGFEQYEISNFARPGFECRHNLAYWHGDEYFAYGPGAARYLCGRRETNIRSVLGWLARLQRGMSPVADIDELPAEGRARELLFVGLRKTAGIEFADFKRRTGYDVEQLAGPAIARNRSRGWLEIVDASVRLTREGRFVADRVVADFL